MPTKAPISANALNALPKWFQSNNIHAYFPLAIVLLMASGLARGKFTKAMLEAFAAFDADMLLRINGLHTDWLDWLMRLASQKTTWIPLYIYLIWRLYKRYGLRSWYIVTIAVILIVATDQSSGLMKGFFERLRPCRDPHLSKFLHLVNNHCGGQYGFVSSHAANTMGLAVYLYSFFRRRRILIVCLFLWAALNAFSRVYLGVHYPSDVVFGALLGAFWGRLFYHIFRYGRVWLT